MSQLTLIELKTSLNRATARIEALEAALKPFATAARNFQFAVAPDGIDDGFTVECAVSCRSEHNATLSTADFSRAFSAIAQGPDK